MKLRGGMDVVMGGGPDGTSPSIAAIERSLPQRRSPEPVELDGPGGATLRYFLGRPGGVSESKISRFFAMKPCKFSGTSSSG